MPPPDLASFKEEVRLFERLSGANSRALIAEIEQLAQDNRDKDAVIMSQEGQIERLQKQLERLYVSTPPEYTKTLKSAITTDGVCIAVIPIGELWEKKTELERLRREAIEHKGQIYDLEAARVIDDMAIQSLRGEVAKAKTIGAVEAMEKESENFRTSIHEVWTSGKVSDLLLQIAAELRKELA